jgi:hypothetical protein
MLTPGAFKRLWAEFDTQRTGYLRRRDFVPFFSVRPARVPPDTQRLTGVFEVRPYPAEHSVHNLMRSSLPDPVENAAGRVPVATGVKRAVDTRQLQSIIRGIDHGMVHERRKTFTRLYHEARISEEPGRGISFTAMLFLLAHYKLIKDEDALQYVRRVIQLIRLDDLIARRAKLERIDDLVNLDRVRGLLKTVYWRRRFIQHRDQQKRTLNAEADGIPAIVLEPIGSSPEIDFDDGYDQSGEGSRRSSESSRSISPPSSPPRRGPSPNLSPAGSPGRRVSDASMLSIDDGWR